MTPPDTRWCCIKNSSLFPHSPLCDGRRTEHRFVCKKRKIRIGQLGRKAIEVGEQVHGVVPVMVSACLKFEREVGQGILICLLDNMETAIKIQSQKQAIYRKINDCFGVCFSWKHMTCEVGGRILGNGKWFSLFSLSHAC